MKLIITASLAILTLLSISCNNDQANENTAITITDYKVDNASSTIQHIIDEGKIDGIIDHIFSLELVKIFYSQRDYTPAWTNTGNINNALMSIKNIYEDGLNPEDYSYTILYEMNEKFAEQSNIDSISFAKFDVLMTESYIKLAAHLISGKVDPESLKQDWEIETEDYKLVFPEPGKALNAVLDNKKTYEDIEQLKPKHYMYTGLKDALKKFRSFKEKDDWDSIAQGETIKIGDKSERVIAVRARLMASQEMDAYIPVNDSIYDSILSNHIEVFQKRYGIDVDGNVGKQTLYELNIPLDYRIEQIKANLERARWVLYDIEDKFIVVNIPAFELYMIENGKEILTSRVIVGKDHTKSPIFKANMQYIVINPTWTVPRSLYPGYIHKLQNTPDYFRQKNMEVITTKGKAIDIATTDWDQYTIHNFPYMIRQKSGPSNALGFLKCMFPNEHSVYIHDTPARSLFNKDTRAFSHGCIRTQKIRELALLLLEPNDDDWSSEKIDNIITKGKITNVSLKEKIPVLIMYWTAGIGFQGNFYFKPDLYKRDQLLIDALND